jgi:hypothetical protein
MKKTIILGDTLALAIVTLIGFITHGETDMSFLPRFAAIYIPLSVFWFLIAYFLQVFQFEITSNPKQLWRVPLAMLFAAPLAVIVRGIILQTEIIATFMLALDGASALGMTLWRGLYFLLSHKWTDT